MHTLIYVLYENRRNPRSTVLFGTKFGTVTKNDTRKRFWKFQDDSIIKRQVIFT